MPLAGLTAVDEVSAWGAPRAALTGSDEASLPVTLMVTAAPVAVLAASGNVVTLGSTAGAVAHDAVAAPVVSVVSANSTSSKNRSLPDAAGLRLLYATA